jgi:hypothetical protein
LTCVCLGSALAATLVSDRPDGLFPTVVVDEQGIALGLVYSNTDSIVKAVDTGRGVYYSRSRYSNSLLSRPHANLKSGNQFGTKVKQAETLKNLCALR